MVKSLGSKKKFFLLFYVNDGLSTEQSGLIFPAGQIVCACLKKNIRSYKSSGYATILCAVIRQFTRTLQVYTHLSIQNTQLEPHEEMAE